MAEALHALTSQVTPVRRTAGMLGIAPVLTVLVFSLPIGAGLLGTLLPAFGYLPALGSAFIWASYSLMTRRVAPFPTAAIGLFGLVSGLLSLICHWLMEPAVALQTRDWMLVAAMGLGPLGAAFFLWDKALKHGDPRQIGVLSYITPLASTVLLLIVSGRPLSWSIGLAAVLIIGAAVIGTRQG